MRRAKLTLYSFTIGPFETPARDSFSARGLASSVWRHQGVRLLTDIITPVLTIVVNDVGGIKFPVPADIDLRDNSACDFGVAVLENPQRIPGRLFLSILPAHHEQDRICEQCGKAGVRNSEQRR